MTACPACRIRTPNGEIELKVGTRVRSTGIPYRERRLYNEDQIRIHIQRNQVFGRITKVPDRNDPFFRVRLDNGTELTTMGKNSFRTGLWEKA
jgi:hypothetical protein